MARDYGIVMLSFPAHTTHRLQPLDRSFFKSLKNSYNEVASSWLRSNPGSVIKQANVSELLGNAYPRSVRMDIALNGFKATGLWPCDRNIIKEEDFVASVHISDPSNQELADATGTTSLGQSLPRDLASPINTNQSIAVTPQSTTSPTIVATSPKVTPPIVPRVATPSIFQPGPSTISHGYNTATLDEITNQQMKSYLDTLSPVPCIKTVIKKINKGTKPTLELTSSPYKNEVEAKENIKKKKKPILDMKKVKIEKGVKDTIKRRKIDKINIKNTKTKYKESWLCQLCNEDRKENMVQCIKCKGWVHDLCADVDNKIKKYICDICVQTH